MASPLRPLASLLLALGLALVQLVGLSIATRPSAAACSCEEFTLDSALAEGDAAFVGAAIDRNEGDHTGFDMSVRWSFEVSSVIKGELPATLEVWSGSDDGDCGAMFELGEPVGVVLRRRDDRYTTNICGGIWLADELRAPGALAGPTGTGAVALVATGRTGDAMIASYDIDGNLTAWGLGDAADGLSHLRICPGSKVLVGMNVDPQGPTHIVRRDVATLSVLGSATLPTRSPDSWPQFTDNRGFRCTSPDGDVAFLVSASGYEGDSADNVVVWVDGETTTMHPVEDAYAFAVAPDLSSAYVVTGDGGTMVEVVGLADGTTRPFAELPEGVGGRVLGVDHATGRVAVIATSNPAATNRGDPAAPDDRLIVFDDRGAMLTSVTLDRTGLVDRVGWLDGDRLIIVYSIPTTHVEVIGLDGTVHSSFQPDAHVRSGALRGDRLYLGTDDGIVSTALDGSDPRPLPLSIARVRDVVAIDDGPTAAPQPTPTVPPPPTDGAPATDVPASSPAIAADSDDSSSGSTGGLIAVAAVSVALICAALAYVKRRQAARSSLRLP